MIVSDVTIRLRRVFGDEAAVQVSDDDIIRWINDAQVEIVRNNDAALQKTGFIDLVAGTSQYTLPADMFLLRSLRYKYTSMASYSYLRYKNMQQFDDAMDGWDGTLYSNSSPCYFTMYEQKAILFPTPDQSAVNGLKILYNQKPTDVVNQSSALGLPLLYHNVILKYCLWQASLLDEDHEPALMYKSNFQEDIDLLQMKETRDPIERYSTITVLEEDM